MRRYNNVYILTVCALMISIMLLFGFTPIGTISTGALTITLMGIPVAIMACLFGPIMGALAGLSWGLISLAQAFMGMDATGAMILASENLSPFTKYFGLFTICVVARVLCGFLSGFIYDLVKKFDSKGFWASLVGSMSTSLLNTIFFMTFFCLFFYNMPEIQEQFNPQNVFVFIFTIIGFNFIIEFVVNGVVGSSATYGICKAADHLGVNNPLPRFFQEDRVKEVKEK